MRCVVIAGYTWAFFVLCLAVAGPAAEPQADANERLQEVLAESGVQGGLIVHLGGRDAALTMGLHATDSFLVHGLDTDPETVAAARETIRAAGGYGKVSVEQYDGENLPYTDNLVNLIVAEDVSGVSDSELMRVLVPEGVALVKQEEQWTRKVKARPDGIDEWTHFMHDASGNAVAADERVGPPNHMQWIGGPKWARGHENLATVSAVVSSDGRIFYIADEGPTASVTLPSNWVLIARDAYNGVLLWKQPIPDWEWRLRAFRSGPPQLPRRLVAVDGRVYVTLGYGTQLTALDPATGETIAAYEGTENTEEIIWDDGILYLVVGDPEQQQAVSAAVRRGETRWTETLANRRLMAIEADSGKVLWEKSDRDTAELLAMTLAVQADRVFFQSLDHVVALAASSGEEIWRAERNASLSRPGWSVPTLVVYDGVVLSADRRAGERTGEPARPRNVDWDLSFGGGNAPDGELIAYSAESGEKLWNCPAREGYNSPVDVLVADGLVWSGELVKARDPGITVARDVHTGEIRRERPDDQEFFSPGMSHHRCYRNKATEKFLLLGRSGVEFIDVQTGKAAANHWIRGTCQYGIMPANGLLYVPPHTCACYIKTKLSGFNALAARHVERSNRDRTEASGAAQSRLLRGEAYGKVAVAGASSESPTDWPTYRHDAARSGATTAAVPAQLRRSWEAELGGRLSSLVVAEQRVFVSQVDANTVHALSASDGLALWSYTVGGSVDSPPTAYRGMVLFGSTDGHVYCLRAEDGQLVWRFRAGPEDRRVVAYGALESSWPIHGTILVDDGVAYFAAGRSSFLDGGIYLFGLDAATGRIVTEGLLSGRDAETGEQPKEAIKGFDMPSGLPHVLTSDGEFLYMGDLKYDRQFVQQAELGTHLFSPTSLLDDSFWHRSYWVYGTHFNAGWGGWWKVGNQVPAGRIMVHDDETIYGFGRNMMPRGNAGQWKTGEYYQLFAASKELKTVQETPPAGRKGQPRKPVSTTVVDQHWSYPADLEVRAMVLADQMLFVAGVLGETHRSLDAFGGKEGIQLRAVSAENGAQLAEYPLDGMPVFDGLIAASGQLYLTTKNGKVTCFAGK